MDCKDWEPRLEKILEWLPTVLAAYLLLLWLVVWIAVGLGVRLALPPLPDDLWLLWWRLRVWAPLLLMIGGL